MKTNTRDAKTLKAAGEWLEQFMFVPYAVIPDKMKEGLRKLLHGEMPERDLDSLIYDLERAELRNWEEGVREAISVAYEWGYDAGHDDAQKEKD